MTERNLTITQKFAQHYVNNIGKHHFLKWLKMQDWDVKTEERRHCALSTFFQYYFNSVYKTTPRLYNFYLSKNYKAAEVTVPTNIYYDFSSAMRPLPYKVSQIPSSGDASTEIFVMLPKWVAYYAKNGK